MKKCLFLLVVLFTVLPLTGNAADPAIWTTLQIKKTFFEKLSLTTSAGLHTQKVLDGQQLLSIGESIYYKFNNHFGVNASYSYIDYHWDRFSDMEGNRIDAFWSPRHSMSMATLISYPISQVDCSFRLMFNVIFRPEHTITSGEEQLTVNSKTNEKLRLRFRLTWNNPQSRWKPYLNVERFTRIGHESHTKLEKTRYAVGTDYAINSTMAIQGYFLYQDHADDIELCGSVLGATYKINF